VRIIDKQKDYYDYLRGVFGEDPLAVYDRRGSILFNKESLPLPFKKIDSDNGSGYYGVITLVSGFVCRKIYFENFPWEKKLFEVFDEFRITRETSTPIRMRIDYAEYKKGEFKTHMKFTVDAEKNGFPIRYSSGRHSSEDEYFCNGKDRWWNLWHVSFRNPILQSIPLMIVPAESMFEEIHEFLLSLNDKPIVDSRTDSQKLEAAGFDKRTSFRKM